MFHPLATIVAVAALWANHASAAALHGHPIRHTTAFDGQYLAANSSNLEVEWWYIQAVAEPVGDESPANVVVVFYQGNADSNTPAGSTEPEFSIAIDGSFANGTSFSIAIPTTIGTVTTEGQAVQGDWSPAGNFALTSDFETFTIGLNAPEYGVTGSLILTSAAPHHYGCNVTNDPYLKSSVPAGTQLSPSEEVLFTEFGWAVTVPGGGAKVDLLIDGTALQFIGNGYHDHNFSPVPLIDFASEWYWLQAQVGPYILTGAIMQAINSTLQANTGYLAEAGMVLQNQCGIVGARTIDINTATPYGSSFDTVTGTVVPEGFILGYTLVDGEQYSFNLTGRTINPNLPVYYRWTGTATGGKVGGEQYSGTTIYSRAFSVSTGTMIEQAYHCHCETVNYCIAVP